MDLNKKIEELLCKEQNETRMKDAFVKVAQEINSLKRQMNENDIKSVACEREITALEKEINELEVNQQIISSKLDALKCKVAKKFDVKARMSAALVEVHNSACDMIKEAVGAINGTLDETIAEQNSVMAAPTWKITDDEAECLKLEGEREAMELFKEVQERQLKLLDEKLDTFFPEADLSL